MEQMLKLMKSTQKEMRTHGAKMDAETKAIKVRTKAIQARREDGAKSTNDAVRSGTSGVPYGRGHSETFGNNEEAAQGSASSCRATQRAKGTDARRLDPEGSWLPPAGRCLDVQQWHGARKTSAGEF
jgi:hypothetical protein